MGAEEAEGELVGAEEEGVEGDVPSELRAQPDEEPAGALWVGGWRVWVWVWGDGKGKGGGRATPEYVYKCTHP